MSRADRLSAFIRRFDEVPVTWGVDDCSAVASRWVAEEIGRAVDYPDYDSEAGALATRMHGGGLVTLWDERLAAIGIGRRYGEPELGDVAILDTRTLGLVGCIVAKGRIALVRNAAGGFRPLGPVREFEAVWEVS